MSETFGSGAHLAILGIRLDSQTYNPHSSPQDSCLLGSICLNRRPLWCVTGPSYGSGGEAGSRGARRAQGKDPIIHVKGQVRPCKRFERSFR
jgi:hypothetical protein